MVTAKKVHAEGNLQLARHFILFEVLGPERHPNGVPKLSLRIVATAVPAITPPTTAFQARFIIGRLDAGCNDWCGRGRYYRPPESRERR